MASDKHGTVRRDLVILIALACSVVFPSPLASICRVRFDLMREHSADELSRLQH